MSEGTHKKKPNKALSIFLWFFIYPITAYILFWAFFLGGHYGDISGAIYTHGIAHARSYEASFITFKDTFGGIPGDMSAAATRIPDCNAACVPALQTADDGIIGSLDFGKTLRHPITKTTNPATSVADETVLFWQHLEKTGLMSGVTEAGLKDGQAFAWDETHPSLRKYSGFIVGSSDGSPFPFSPFSKGIRGIIVVQVTSPDGSVPLDATGKQPLSPYRAEQIDRKMDDGKPNSGFVQAYGAPACFIVNEEKKTVEYSALGTQKNCGLIYKIADLPSLPKEKTPP